MVLWMSMHGWSSAVMVGVWGKTRMVVQVDWILDVLGRVDYVYPYYLQDSIPRWEKCGFEKEIGRASCRERVS